MFVVARVLSGGNQRTVVAAGSNTDVGFADGMKNKFRVGSNKVIHPGTNVVDDEWLIFSVNYSQSDTLAIYSNGSLLNQSSAGQDGPTNRQLSGRYGGQKSKSQIAEVIAFDRFFLRQSVKLLKIISTLNTTCTLKSRAPYLLNVSKILYTSKAGSS